MIIFFVDDLYFYLIIKFLVFLWITSVNHIYLHVLWQIIPQIKDYEDSKTSVSLNHGPSIHQFPYCPSTEKLIFSFVVIIHERPTWWKTTDLIKIGNIYLFVINSCLTSEIWKRNNWLQQVHIIQTSDISSASNLACILNKTTDIIIEDKHYFP